MYRAIRRPATSTVPKNGAERSSLAWPGRNRALPARVAHRSSACGAFGIPIHSQRSLFCRFGLTVKGVILSLSLCYIIPAWASVESEIYRTSALIAISERNFSLALAQLEQAVADDPNDISARYYRGIVLSRLGRFPAAVTDLETVQATGEPLPRLHFELGYAYYRQQDFAKAQTALERSVQENPSHAAGNYYLGLVYYKQAAFARALEPLAAAARLDPSYAASAAYLKGDALKRIGRLDEARKVLVEAGDQYPDSSYADGFSRLVQGIRLQRKQQKRFSLEVRAGTTTDSNVGLFPDELTTTVPEEDENDQRLEVSLSARYRVLMQSPTTATLGYQFFYSRHEDLGEFDVRSHVVSADLRHAIGTVSLGLSYQFLKAFLDNKEYSEIHAVIPNLTIQHGRTRASLIKLQWSDNSYDFDTQAGRSGNTSAVQYRHYWLGGNQRHRYLGTRAVYDNTNDRVFRYSGFGLETGLQRSLLPDWTVKVDLSYEKRFYREANPDREDEHYEAVLRLIRKIDEHFELEIALRGIVNSSDAEAFDYSRGLGSFLFRWRL